MLTAFLREEPLLSAKSSATLSDPGILMDTLRMERLHLSVEEELEIVNFQLIVKPWRPKAFAVLAANTKNVGIQHIMLNNHHFSQFRDEATCNPNLHPEAIILFLERLQELNPVYLQDKWRTALDSLIRHEVTVANVEVFKAVWATAVQVGHPNVPVSGNVYHSVLFRVLDSHSRAKAPFKDAMSVETLVFILSYLKNLDQNEIEPDLNKLVSLIIELRGGEISEWVAENIPDCEDLPLSWVLKILDLYI